MTDIRTHGGLSAEHYLRDRVDTQLRWYGDKSASAKRWHQGLQLATVVLAASVPVLTLASGDDRVRIAVAVIGALTTVAAGLGSLYGFRERWIEYRSAAEAIKHEKYLFLTGVAPYATEDAFSSFVKRVESILRDEHVTWRERLLDDTVEEPVSDRSTQETESPGTDPMHLATEHARAPGAAASGARSLKAQG